MADSQAGCVVQQQQAELWFTAKLGDVLFSPSSTQYPSAGSVGTSHVQMFSQVTHIASYVVFWMLLHLPRLFIHMGGRSLALPPPPLGHGSVQKV